MLTDPIADYLTRVRNALRADHPEVEVPSSRLKKEMTRILVEQGYVNHERSAADQRSVRVRDTPRTRPISSSVATSSLGNGKVPSDSMMANRLKTSR